MLRDPQNGEHRPREGRLLQSHHRNDDTRILAGPYDPPVADRWAEWSLRRLTGVLCDHCGAHRRHHESTLCAGCLEIGAGDVWQGGAP